MKQAIWKVSPFGDFFFRGVHADQLTLVLENPDMGPLKDAIIQHFIAKGWIYIEDVDNFVSSDATDYHSGQYKKVLKDLEKNDKIEIDESTRRKKLTYPNGTKIKIKQNH